ADLAHCRDLLIAHVREVTQEEDQSPTWRQRTQRLGQLRVIAGLDQSRFKHLVEWQRHRALTLLLRHPQRDPPHPRPKRRLTPILMRVRERPCERLLHDIMSRLVAPGHRSQGTTKPEIALSIEPFDIPLRHRHPLNTKGRPRGVKSLSTLLT